MLWLKLLSAVNQLIITDMENENTTIHDFDIELICSYFAGLHRQGPGSDDTTLKALGFIEGLPQNARIADIGCGTGTPTLTLAHNTQGNITAVDLFPDFIKQLNQRVLHENLQHRVNGIVGNMENLPFAANELDLLWSEGAIYNIGFERSITEWKRFIKPDGYLAVTEASWLTNERPTEIETFWNNAYPGIDTVANKVAQMQKAGYIPVATFVIPETCWTHHFYAPQVAHQIDFLNLHAGNKTAKAFIANERHEAKLYEQYKAFYGYVFYIGKKM
jgi:ubiquinone/menaquinone biosynthesis C-methylase UbiE